MPNRSITRKSRNISASTISRSSRGHSASCTAKKNCGRTLTAAHAYAIQSSLLSRRRSGKELRSENTKTLLQVRNGKFETGRKSISNPKSEIRNLKLDSTRPRGLDQYNLRFRILDFGFEMGFRPISNFPLQRCLFVCVPY